jgi:uncharacterized membrane protein
VQQQVQTGDHFRFHAPHEYLASPFGEDPFGKTAEKLARVFGTPKYIMVQTGIVLIWIAINAVALLHFDPYPFILLNLAFSLQAAYAAPLILLAQTRQALRDKIWSEADALHREDLSNSTLVLLRQNTDLTNQVAELSKELQRLTLEIHRKVTTT